MLFWSGVKHWVNALTVFASLFSYCYIVLVLMWDCRGRGTRGEGPVFKWEQAPLSVWACDWSSQGLKVFFTDDYAHVNISCQTSPNPTLHALYRLFLGKCLDLMHSFMFSLHNFQQWSRCKPMQTMNLRCFTFALCNFHDCFFWQLTILIKYYAYVQEPPTSLFLL